MKLRYGRLLNSRIQNLGTVALLSLVAIASAASAQPEVAVVNEVKVGSPASVREQPLELSGCAVVDGGILIVEDELIGAVLFMPEPTKVSALLSTIKLERRKKFRAPYTNAFKLFPYQDFEDIASDGRSTVYMIGSHNGKEGERRPDREFLLKGNWNRDSRDLKVVGEQYKLLDAIAPVLDVLGCGIGLSTTEVSSALNIEGLALQGDTIHIGLRAPLTPEGHAIVLSGPADAVLAGTAPLEATTLDLKGNGVRALEWDALRGALLVVSGASEPDPGDNRSSALFAYDPAGKNLTLLVAFPPEISRKGPEGICRLPGVDSARLLLALDGEGSDKGGEIIELED